jgi:hypothetical protein
MITEKQLERIRLMSDETLYREAIDLMHSIGTANSLPSTQINGLLNVSLANTYDHLMEFVKHQRDRTTWNKREQQYVPDFYQKLFNKLQSLVREHLPSITPQGKPSSEDVEGIKMLIAREFIQHLLAENSYMALQARYHTTERKQGRPQGNRENRGGYHR